MILWTCLHLYASQENMQACCILLQICHVFMAQESFSWYLEHGLQNSRANQTDGGGGRVSHRAPWMGTLTVESCSPPIFWFILKKQCQRLMFLFLLFCKSAGNNLFSLFKAGWHWRDFLVVVGLLKRCPKTPCHGSSSFCLSGYIHGWQQPIIFLHLTLSSSTSSTVFMSSPLHP